MTQGNPTPYEAIGEGQLHRLIDAFYSKVQKHPDLHPIFPDDLTETIRKQKQFMTSRHLQFYTRRSTFYCLMLLLISTFQNQSKIYIQTFVI